MAFSRFTNAEIVVNNIRLRKCEIRKRLHPSASQYGDDCVNQCLNNHRFVKIRVKTSH